MQQMLSYCEFNIPEEKLATNLFLIILIIIN